jgi:hypothetical protein
MATADARHPPSHDLNFKLAGKNEAFVRRLTTASGGGVLHGLRRPADRSMQVHYQ